MAVGLAGKLSSIIFGAGQLSRIARSSSAKKSPSGVSFTWRTSAPAMTTP